MEHWSQEPNQYTQIPNKKESTQWSLPRLFYMADVCAYNYYLDDIDINADEKTNQTPIIDYRTNNQCYQWEVDQKQIEYCPFDMI